MPLNACVLFSSIAGLFAGAGQSNYSAANCCLDALAESRRSCGQAGTSVQWGPWADVGMAAGVAVSARLQGSGIGLIGVQAGTAALGAALQPHAPPVLAMVVVDWRRLLGTMASASALLSGFAAGGRAAHAATPGSLAGVPLSDGVGWVKVTVRRRRYFVRRRRHVRQQDSSRVSPRPACDAGCSMLHARVVFGRGWACVWRGAGGRGDDGGAGWYALRKTSRSPCVGVCGHVCARDH